MSNSTIGPAEDAAKVKWWEKWNLSREPQFVAAARNVCLCISVAIWGHWNEITFSLPISPNHRGLIAGAGGKRRTDNWLLSDNIKGKWFLLAVGNTAICSHGLKPDLCHNFSKLLFWSVTAWAPKCGVFITYWYQHGGGANVLTC